jgi:hypothetical protein
LFEFSLILYTLTDWLNAKDKLWPKLLMGFYFAFWVFNICYSNFLLLNEYNLTIERVVLMGLSGYFMLMLFTHMDRRSPFRNPKFWIAAGIFVYFTCTIALYSTVKLLTDQDFEKYFTLLNSFINIFGNTLYTIGFLCIFQNRK